MPYAAARQMGPSTNSLYKTSDATPASRSSRGQMFNGSCQKACLMVTGRTHRWPLTRASTAPDATVQISCTSIAGMRSMASCNTTA